MADHAIRDHLVRLVVDNLAHFWRSPEGRDGNRCHVPILQVRTEVGQIGLTVVSIMPRERFAMIFLQELLQLLFVRDCL